MVKSFFKHHLRNGKQFRNYLRELEGTEKFSSGELDDYQNELLKGIIKIAYEGVPYYQKIFRERRLTPSDIRTKADLQKLPEIDKNTVNTYFRDFRNTRFHGLVSKAMTSGSSGSPGVFLRDMKNINFENAAIWRSWHWHGKVYGTKRIVLRGDLIVPAHQDSPPYWKEDPFAKELLFSSYHLSEETLPGYVDAMRLWGFCDLYAYPSTAYLLAQYCQRFGKELHFSKVFTSSEILLPHQRILIEDVFACKVADWYGSAERIAAIGQCEQGNYHEMSDYSIVEYVPLENGGCRIIGTGLHNSVMPLIRFSLGDIIEADTTEERCACGRSFRRIKRIMGRQTDYIVTPEGKRISIINHIPWGLNGIREMQVVQDKAEELSVYIVVDDRYTSKTAGKLQEAFKSYISPRMKFSINEVPSIERTSAGKYRVIVQNINNA